MVQVWQEVVGRRPATARRSGAARQGPRGAPPRRPVPRPGWGTHSLQVGPWVLGRQRQAPVRGSQPWPSAPPTSHRQPRARGAGHAHRAHLRAPSTAPHPAQDPAPSTQAPGALPTASRAMGREVNSPPTGGRRGLWTTRPSPGSGVRAPGRLVTSAGRGTERRGACGARASSLPGQAPIPHRAWPHSALPGALAAPPLLGLGLRGWGPGTQQAGTHCGSRSSWPGPARRSRPCRPRTSGCTRGPCRSSGHRSGGRGRRWDQAGGLMRLPPSPNPLRTWPSHSPAGTRPLPPVCLWGRSCSLGGRAGWASVGEGPRA